MWYNIKWFKICIIGDLKGRDMGKNIRKIVVGKILCFI